MAYDVKVPINIGEDKKMQMLEDFIANSRQSLRMLLLTHQYERLLDANYGVGIRGYLFEPMTQQLKDNLSASIKNQAARYIPTISINKIDITAVEEEQKLYVKIGYTYDSTISDNFILEVV